MGTGLFTGRCARYLKVRLENEAEAARGNEGLARPTARRLVYDPPMNVQWISVTEATRFWPERESGASITATVGVIG